MNANWIGQRRKREAAFVATLATWFVSLAVIASCTTSQAWGDSFADCDFTRIEREAKAEEVESICRDCRQECAFRKMLLSSKRLITTAQAALEAYEDHLPSMELEIADAETSVGLGCTLTDAAAAADPARRAKLTEAAQNIFAEVLEVSQTTIDGLSDLPEDADAGLLMRQAATHRDAARASSTQVEEWATCPQMEPVAPAEVPGAAGPDDAPSPEPAPDPVSPQDE